MSNGIGKNPLIDISKVYVQQVVEKKKDDTYLEPDMKKRQANNEKARKELAKGPQMKNPHFESVEKSGWDAIKACADGYKAVYKEAVKGQDSEMRKAASAERKSGYKRLSPSAGKAYADQQKQSISYMDKKTKNNKIVVGMTHEALDPVGKEDGDVNNDGKKDSSDKYLMKRRSAIGKAMASTKKKMTEGVRDLDPEKGTEERKARLEKKRGMKLDDHPQYTKEELEASGLFTAEEIEEILEKMEYERDMDHPKTTRETKAGDPNQITTREPVKRPSTIKDKKSPKKMYPGKYQDSGGVVLGRKVRVDEADSLAAMAARREKRLARQRKQMGTSSTGQDFGHDYGISSAERKKRQQAEFDKFVGKKTQKEAYSSWRTDLSEVMTDDVSDKPIKEKKVSNTIKINPKLGEAIEAMGGELIEATEIKEEAAMSDKEIRLQKQKARIDQMIAMRRKQDLSKKSEAPTKAMGEGKELSIDDQMRISREANAKRKPYQPGDRQKQRAAQLKQMANNAKKDTRTDAQKMTDATGPRPGSRYRGD